MKIAILIFDGVTALDAIGLYEVLSRLPKAHVCFVGLSEGPKRTDNGMLALLADYSIKDIVHPGIGKISPKASFPASQNPVTCMLHSVIKCDSLLDA